MILSPLINSVLDLLFPKFCLRCGVKASYLCDDCKENFLVKSNVSFAFEHKLFDDLLICDYYHKNPTLKQLIFLYKFKFDKNLANILGYFLFKTFQWRADFYDDFIVVPAPTPLHKIRLRGFNHSKLLAESFLNNLDKNWELINCLERKFLPDDQKTLNRLDRENFVRGSIFLKSESEKLLRDRNVLLIDDIITTGSTLNECSLVLREVGVKKIVALVLAKS